MLVDTHWYHPSYSEVGNVAQATQHDAMPKDAPARSAHLCSLPLALGVLLGYVRDLEGCSEPVLANLRLCMLGYSAMAKLTRWQTLLELVGLVRVLEDQSVKVPVAPDLELDLLRLAVALNLSGYWRTESAHGIEIKNNALRAPILALRPRQHFSTKASGSPNRAGDFATGEQ
jgi:hypothetical protein